MNANMTIHTLKFIRNLKFLQLNKTIITNIQRLVKDIIIIDFIIYKIKFSTYDGFAYITLDGNTYNTPLWYLITDFKTLPKLRLLKLIDKIFVHKNNTCTKTIHNNFILGNNIKLIDLNILNNVTHIKDCFLSNNKLTSIDLSPLINLTKIGDYFLQGSSLKTLDMSSLVNLITIGEFFIYKSEIKNLNMSNLTKLVEIKKFFCAYTKICELNLFDLVNLSSLCNKMLVGIPIKYLKLPNSRKITSIDLSFLQNVNDNLIECIDLSGLINLKTIPNTFLLSKNVKTFIFPNN